ncbi:MAG: PqqD family protein [Selenomonadaceae bacterium]|nr:PqqD family protein [Selenomonadaceae bacterium]
MIFAWLKDKIPHCSFVKKRINDDILIVCSNDLMIYYFNATAAFFIQLADGKTTVDEIKTQFVKNYEVSEEELETDFIDMIRDLQWKGIVTLE